MFLSRFVILFLCLLPTVFLAQLELVLQTGHNSDIQKVAIHPTQNYCLSYDEDQVLVIWDLDLNSQFSSISLSNEVSDVSFFNDSVLVVGKKGGLEFWNFKKEVIIKREDLSQPVKQLFATEKGFYYLSDQVYKRIGLEGPEQVVSGTQGLNRFTVSESGKYIGGASSVGDKLIEAASGSVMGSWKTPSYELGVSDINEIFIRCEEKAILRSYTIGEGNSVNAKGVLTNIKVGHRFNTVVFKENFFITGDENDIITVVDLRNNKIEKQIKNHGGSITAIDADLNKELLIVGGENGVLNLYNLSNSELLGSYESISPQITAIDFKDESTVLLGYADGAIKEWNLETHEVSTNRIEPSWLDKIRKSTYTITTISSSGGSLKKSYSRDFPTSKEIIKRYALSYAEPSHKIILKRQDLRAKFVGGLKELAPGKYLLESSSVEIVLSQGVKIQEYKMHPSNNYLLASASDGFLYWIDVLTGEVKLKLVSPTDRTFFYITEDNYYYGSKSAMDFVGARLEDQLIGFEQVDLLYNRPDKVLKNLPFFDEEYLSILEQAYQKRLKKLGVSEEATIQPNQLPTLETNLADFPLKTESRDHELTITGKGSRTAQVLINGVPVFGRLGVGLDNSGRWKGVLSLSEGSNKIQVFVEDANGFKSIRHEKNVYCNVETQSELYILSIGSGEFMNENFNLKYAGKDALDIVNNFKDSKEFVEVHVKELVGPEVSLGNIGSAIADLKKAKVDDVVLVFFAGHGVLDAELDYYLSTYEMNFDRPSDGGMLYADLENQLSDLSCRNKVLLIDACHSGEIDKEELVTTNVKEEEIELVEFRSGTSSVGWVGGKSVFELSKNIFVDLRKNSGVVTISSAGGAEYAMEGEQWKNGVFTYCILNGFQNMKADINGDKKIYIAELQEYLFKEVPRMTNGKQTPTSRVEILDQEIRLW